MNLYRVMRVIRQAIVEHYSLATGNEMAARVVKEDADEQTLIVLLESGGFGADAHEAEAVEVTLRKIPVEDAELRVRRSLGH